MLKHILIPLDGSDTAERAVAHGQQLINPGSEITLLVAVDSPEYVNYSIYGTQPIAPAVVAPQTAFDYQALTDEMVAQSNTYLDRIAQELQSGGYKVQRLVEMGSPADLIVDTAEKLGVDAIVMSTHGRSGLSRWLLGSVTSKVLGHAPCPVYVIPPDKSKDDA